MKRSLLIALAALAFTGAAGAAPYAHAPAISTAAAAKSFCWDYAAFPLPYYGAYYQSAADGRTENIGGPDGINLRYGTCQTLRRTMRGWRPSGERAIADVAWHIYALGHEAGHATAPARGENFLDEKLADAYGRGPEFERICARLGIGPYWRRLLRNVLDRTGPVYARAGSLPPAPGTTLAG
jgi:hypothetical protein